VTAIPRGAWKHLPGGEDSHKFGTFQEAVEACRPGDFIFVTPYGVYGPQPVLAEEVLHARPRRQTS